MLFSLKEIIKIVAFINIIVFMFHIDIGLPVFYFDVAETHHPEEVKIKQSILKNDFSLL